LTWLAAAKINPNTVILGPRSGTRNPEPLSVIILAPSAALDSGFAFGAPE
jgi:hypothetical protein